MALEDLTGVAKFISALNPAWPVDDDFLDEGDNHVRGIKNVLKNTFPNLNAAVTLTPDQLNNPYAPRRFLGRNVAVGVGAVALGWAAVVADAKLVAIEVDIEQLVPAANGSVEMLFLRSDGATFRPGTPYHTLFMGHASNGPNPVGAWSTAQGGITMGSLTGGNPALGMSGRVRFPMLTNAYLRGLAEWWSVDAQGNPCHFRSMFQTDPDASNNRPGGIAFRAGGGAVAWTICNFTAWGHYIP